METLKKRTVAQAARAASKVNIPPSFYSCFKTDVLAGNSKRSRKGVWRHNLTTTTAVGYTNAYDWLAKSMGMGPSFTFATAAGAATSTTSATLVNASASFPTSGQGLAGQYVVAATAGGALVYMVITSNTNTTLTGDQWYNVTSTSAASGSTPSGTGQYVVMPGQAPACWLAVTANVFTPLTSDATLAGELTSTTGFARAVGTYAHTAAASTYTLVHLWTATGAGATVNNEAQFGAATITAGGVMPFESAEPSPPTLVSGDTLQNTITISI